MPSPASRLEFGIRGATAQGAFPWHSAVNHCTRDSAALQGLPRLAASGFNPRNRSAIAKETAMTNPRKIATACH